MYNSLANTCLLTALQKAGSESSGNSTQRLSKYQSSNAQPLGKASQLNLFEPKARERGLHAN